MEKTALITLSKDKHFPPLVKKYGEPTLRRGSDPFAALVRSIIHQQLSGKAAGTIHARFLALFGTSKKHPTPEQVLAMSTVRMRGAGLSLQKCSYLHDLALKFSDGTIQKSKLKRMKSSDIIEHLVQVKGIGEWSVQMFLIFTLERLDVLPTGDLGVRKGFQIVYKLKELPTKKTMEEKAAPWREVASLAAWYFWRVADDAKLKK